MSEITNVKLKSIKLENYCGYRDLVFDFVDEKTGEVKPLSLFFGPNGTGKSTFLNAVNLVSYASCYEGRSTDLLFRKITYNKDYNPATFNYRYNYARDFSKDEEYKKKVMSEMNVMNVIATFSTDQGDKVVHLTSEDGVGVAKNELPKRGSSYCYFIDADKASNLGVFQVAESEYLDIFLDMAKIVYGFDCWLEKGSRVQHGQYYFYTDLVIDKYGDRIHYKCMSDGEKKIAKLLEAMCKPEQMNNTNIICVDNSMMHIYFKRHPKMIDKILESFPDKQFIFTTHSGVLIDHTRSKYGEGSLYDLEKYKLQDLKTSDQELIS